CIKDISQVNKLIITASGGPFLDKSIDFIKNATVEQALTHPRWKMGRKITIDSATLVNKGLEVIEAHHLFNMDYKDIEVVIHPQSVVHSAIEYIDGSVIAQLGIPSMHIPIQYAITYPKRFEGIKTHSFSFSEIAHLDFSKPDFDKFKGLKLAYNAGEIGGSMPVCFNASNEEAVFAFLRGEIKLYDIYDIISTQMEKFNPVLSPSLDDILKIDEEVRIKTREFIQR
ncbi:1-deoxy-D-xylulose-5-phosphate reductoisomerase, partial [bacterium]|nr:1-deoxy-D-xylulose-5-phosphate reductoisomerase [bacterium]